MRCAKKRVSPVLMVSGDVIMCRWCVATDRTINKKRMKISLTIYPWFKAEPFYQISIGGEFNLEQPDQQCLLAWADYQFCPLFQGLLTGVGKMALAGEEGAGPGRNFIPSKCYKKSWFQDKHRGILHPAFDPDFWLNILSICSLHNHISKLFRLRIWVFLITKTEKSWNHFYKTNF